MKKKLVIKILFIFILILTIENLAYVESTALTYSYDVNAQEIQFPIGKDFILINGKPLKIDEITYVNNNGISMIPLRLICNLYGVDKIDWDSKKKSATVLIGNRSSTFTVGQTSVLINSIPIAFEGLNGSPEIKLINEQGVLYIPIRTFGMVFGIDVDWEEESRTAFFNKGVHYLEP